MTSTPPLPFASVADLNLDFDLDDGQTRDAEQALEEASNLARYYGADWPDPAIAPYMVRTIVLRAVRAYMRNPDGFTQSRAGDETVGWPDRGISPIGRVEFTPDEIKMLQSLAGKDVSGVMSVQMFAWTNKPVDPDIYVPVIGSTEKPFPFLEV